METALTLNIHQYLWKQNQEKIVAQIFRYCIYYFNLQLSVLKVSILYHWTHLLNRSSAGTSPNEGFLSGSVPNSLPTFQHPSHSLLKENNFTQQVYHKYHSRCLKGEFIPPEEFFVMSMMQIECKIIGKCQDSIQYQWSLLNILVISFACYPLRYSYLVKKVINVTNYS